MRRDQSWMLFLVVALLLGVGLILTGTDAQAQTPDDGPTCYPPGQCQPTDTPTGTPPPTATPSEFCTNPDGQLCAPVAQTGVPFQPLLLAAVAFLAAGGLILAGRRGGTPPRN